ncbi:MAG: UDP-glucose 4-epimerase GalE [Rhodospirillaceae bacterium]
MTKCVLVTGGAGYIGSHTVIALREAGWDVAVADDLSTGSEQLLPDDVRLFVGNVGDPVFIGGLLRRERPEAIIHFAGSLSVPESIADPLKYYTNNFVNSCRLAEAAVAAGVNRMIFSSTAAVYGTPEKHPVSETAPTCPINPYGRSKLMIEQMLQDVSAAHPLRYVALRYFNVAGADRMGRSGQVGTNSTNLIKVVSELATGRRRSITVHGGDYATVDGTCIRDFIHVSDLADAHVSALSYLMDGGKSEVINCGYGNGYSVLNVLGMASKLAGKTLNYTIGPRRVGDPAQVVADPSRIQRRLAWVPHHDDLELILRSAIAWERSQTSAVA